MKRFAAAGIFAAILTLFTPSPVSADEGCVISVAGIKVCGELLNEPLPEVVTVTVKPDPVRIPGPTVTVRPDPEPGPTETVTETVTEPSEPRTITETTTVRPDIVGPSELPTGATETVTGQAGTESGIITQTPEPEVRTETETRTKTETIVQNVLLGTLVSLLLAGLGILLLWAGYVLGYKGAERQEARSLRNMLDAIVSRGKHT